VRPDAQLRALGFDFNRGSVGRLVLWLPKKFQIHHALTNSH